eukprot:c4766_g1_i1.p1 GENE.c4766_g1_i1~~c4766_g1_i1.p1  ORF type:complete len:577 (-),score=137.82 c4766_g1_i1:126-1808(-)
MRWCCVILVCVVCVSAQMSDFSDEKDDTPIHFDSDEIAENQQSAEVMQRERDEFEQQERNFERSGAANTKPVHAVHIVDDGDDNENADSDLHTSRFGGTSPPQHNQIDEQMLITTGTGPTRDMHNRGARSDHSRSDQHNSRPRATDGSAELDEFDPQRRNNNNHNDEDDENGRNIDPDEVFEALPKAMSLSGHVDGGAINGYFMTQQQKSIQESDTPRHSVDSQMLLETGEGGKDYDEQDNAPQPHLSTEQKQQQMVKEQRELEQGTDRDEDGGDEDEGDRHRPSLLEQELADHLQQSKSDHHSSHTHKPHSNHRIVSSPTKSSIASAITPTTRSTTATSHDASAGITNLAQEETAAHAPGEENQLSQILSSLFTSSGAGPVSGSDVKTPGGGVPSPFNLFWPAMFAPLIKQMHLVSGDPDIFSPFVGGKAPPEERMYTTNAPPVAHWNAALPPPGPLFPMPLRKLPPEFSPIVPDSRYEYFRNQVPKEGDQTMPDLYSRFGPQVMPKSNEAKMFPRSAVAAPLSAPYFGDRGDPMPHFANPASIAFPYPGVFLELETLF